MARLIRKSEPFRAPVYDVAVEGTHSFFAASGPSPDHGILAHNCHRLSKNALDALLKPMEDSVPGSEDKRLVCIFCTTEPEKMVSTIFSRCAPAFVIRSAPLEAIAARLAFICGQENISYEDDALMLAAEQSGSHIRDAIKMVEGVSMMGGVTRENASKYLHLDANDTVLDLLEALESDLPQAVSHAMALSQKMSPSGAYGRLAEAAMLIYQVHLGVTKVPMKWDTERVSTLASEGATWLNVAQRFAAPPHRPTHQTLVLDTATVHHLYGMGTLTAPQVVISAKNATNGSSSSEVGIIPHVDPQPKALAQFHTRSGVYVDPRAIGQGPPDRSIETTSTEESMSNTISPTTFRELVRHHLQGLRSGRTR